MTFRGREWCRRDRKRSQEDVLHHRTEVENCRFCSRNRQASEGLDQARIHRGVMGRDGASDALHKAGFRLSKMDTMQLRMLEDT